MLPDCSILFLALILKVYREVLPLKHHKNLGRPLRPRSSLPRFFLARRLLLNSPVSTLLSSCLLLVISQERLSKRAGCSGSWSPCLDYVQNYKCVFKIFTMPLPPIATIAACGSVITAFKSSWELSRMLKKKEQEKRVESQGRVILKDLRDAHSNGYMNRKSFDKWYDRYLGAIAEKDRM